MRRAVACIACLCALAGARAAPAPRRRLAASSEEIFAGAESDGPSPQSPPSPRAPAAGAATHPLTVLPQFQLDGVSPAVQNQIVELVKRGLAALGEFVHLQGAAPAPLLLPRTCLKVREWRRDGKVTSECIEVREQHVTHSPSRIWPCGSCGLTFVLRRRPQRPAASACLRRTTPLSSLPSPYASGLAAAALRQAARPCLLTSCSM